MQKSVEDPFCYLFVFVFEFVADRVDWLVEFAGRPITRWDGLCLTLPINFVKRSMIKRCVASLLDLRNYLFSRQCTLLLLLKRSLQIGRLAVPFMHNCIRELHILQVCVKLLWFRLNTIKT